MRIEKTFTIIIAIIAAFLFHSDAFAQYDEYMEEEALLSCGTFTVSEHAYWDSNWDWEWSEVTVEGHTKIYTVSEYGSLENARIAFAEWVERVICGVGFEEATVPVDPIVAQNMQSFKSEVFSERARPRAAGRRVKKKESAGKMEDRESIDEKIKAVVLEPDEMSSDIEYEFFDISGMEGKNLAIRGGISRISDSGELSYGGRFFLNRLSFDDLDDNYNNITINLFGNKILLETDAKERTVGGSFNYLLMDKDVNDDNGIALSVHGIDKLFPDENIIVYGGMLQYIKVGDFTALYLNAAGMYGFPYKDEFSINIDGLFTRNISMKYDGESLELDSRNILNLGVTVSIYMSDAFGLNVGAKKTFLVEDYSSFELTLGAGFRF